MSGKQAGLEHVHLGSGSNLEFDRDNSVMTSAIGQAHAYIRFSSSAGLGYEIKRTSAGKVILPSAHCNGTISSAGDMDLILCSQRRCFHPSSTGQL